MQYPNIADLHNKKHSFNERDVRILTAIANSKCYSITVSIDKEWIDNGRMSINVKLDGVKFSVTNICTTTYADFVYASLDSDLARSRVVALIKFHIKSMPKDK